MKTKMFRKLFDELLAAQSSDEIDTILYREDGVDLSYQHDLLSWEDHQRLFALASMMENALVGAVQRVTGKEEPS